MLSGFFILSQLDKEEIIDEIPIYDLETILQNMEKLEKLPFKLGISDYGANLELDQETYTWTDKIYVTVVAPAHNLDSDIVNEIGNLNTSTIAVFTLNHILDQYKLVETGSDTGIFTGELILTGFEYNTDGNLNTGLHGIDTNPKTEPSINGGPFNGFLETSINDSITIVFMTHAYSVIADAKIQWNVGEIQWLEPRYPASGAGKIRVVDPDMNLDPELIDSFKIWIWLDDDPIGINLNVTETNQATGIFEGAVFFNTVEKSAANRIKVSEGSNIYATYEDHTLPEPYSIDDKLLVNATANILPRRVTGVVDVSFDP